MSQQENEKLQEIKSLMSQCLLPPWESPFLNLYRYLENDSDSNIIPDPEPSKYSSFRGFQGRIYTYRPQYWGADPNAVLHFAKYGWKCSEKFTIKCDTCLATVDCSRFIQKPALWESLASEAHDKLCYWSCCPCPDRFTQIVTNPKVLFKKICQSWHKLIQNGHYLPYIQQTVLDTMGFSEDMLVQIFNITESSKTDEGVSALVLVITGWINGSEERSLECAYCQRHLLLNHFISIQNKEERIHSTSIPESAEHDCDVAPPYLPGTSSATNDNYNLLDNISEKTENIPSADVIKTTVKPLLNMKPRQKKTQIKTVPNSATRHFKSFLLHRRNVSLHYRNILTNNNNSKFRIINSSTGIKSKQSKYTVISKQHPTSLPINNVQNSCVEETSYQGKRKIPKRGTKRNKLDDDDDDDLSASPKKNKRKSQKSNESYIINTDGDNEKNDVYQSFDCATSEATLKECTDSSSASEMLGDADKNSKHCTNITLEQSNRTASDDNNEIHVSFAGSSNMNDGNNKTQPVLDAGICNSEDVIDDKYKNLKDKNIALENVEQEAGVKCSDSADKDSVLRKKIGENTNADEIMKFTAAEGNEPGKLVITHSCSISEFCSDDEMVTSELISEKTKFDRKADGKDESNNKLIQDLIKTSNDPGGKNKSDSQGEKNSFLCLSESVKSAKHLIPSSERNILITDEHNTELNTNSGVTNVQLPEAQSESIRPGKRRYNSESEKEEETLRKKIKADAAAVIRKQKHINPIAEHRYWCIWKIKTLDRLTGAPKEGWKQIFDQLKIGALANEPEEKKPPKFFEEIEKLYSLLNDW